MQGFYVRQGNPKQIKGWNDLKRTDITIVNREKGSGTRVLLDERLRLLGVDRSLLPGYYREEYSHLAVASAVARERRIWLWAMRRSHAGAGNRVHSPATGTL